MPTITLAGRVWRLTPTGLPRLAYMLTSGRTCCRGIRDADSPSLILVVDSQDEAIGAFDEETYKEVTILR